MDIGARSSGAIEFESRSLGEWCAFMEERYPGVEVAAPCGGFRARYRAWQSGRVEFAEISASARLDIRVAAPTREAPDCYYLPMQLRGEFRGGQRGQECRAGPRILYLLDSSAPHWRELSAGSRMVNVRLPKAMLDRYLVDPAVCMRPMAADHGLGAVVWEFATALWQRHGEMSAAWPAVAETLAQLAANLFAPPPEPDGSNGISAAHQRRLLQCIHDHLGDLQFDVSQAAADCGISSRYVHVLMRGTGRTFTRYLLERRLECCRAALQSTANRSRTITEIAYRWGFSDMSHFSRAFRKCYGLTPREARPHEREPANEESSPVR